MIQLKSMIDTSNSTPDTSNSIPLPHSVQPWSFYPIIVRINSKHLPTIAPPKTKSESKKSLTFRVSLQTKNPLPPHREELCLPPVVIDFTVQLAPNCHAHLRSSVFIKSSSIQIYMENMRYLQARVSNSHHPSSEFGLGRRKRTRKISAEEGERMAHAKFFCIRSDECAREGECFV